jgi:D-alanyl-D-alanine carboxypeptidase
MRVLPLPGGEIPLTRDRPRDVTQSAAGGAWAAGAIVSNVEDIARFYHALFSGELLRRDLLSELERTVPADGARAGLGVFRTPVACGYAWATAAPFPATSRRCS